MESSSAAEQRAFAVAKLKRAASLPRMQNGRRPKMHVEAVSEGERSQGAASVEPDSETVTPEPRASPGLDDMTIHPVNTFETAFVEPPTPTQSDHPEELPQSSTPAPGFASVHELENENEAEAEPSAAKKRRRSRSRSRGSRDLRKLKGAQSPPLPTTRTTTPALPDDSSPEENQMILPSFLPFTPQVVAPVPSHYAQFQAQRLLMTPEPGMFFNTGMGAFSPPTSPSTPMPGMPTLEDIQRGAAARGLQRSNSAAARMMALNKLTMSQLPSRSNTPGLPGPLGTLALGRNNTVSGAEPRAAARQILLRRLGERIDKGDGVTSGSEERTATPKPPGSSGEDDIPRVSSPRRRRRRSRRGSGAVHAGVVDDRDLSSNAADTSTSVPPTPAIGANETLPEPFFAPLEPTSPMTPVQLERQNTLNKLRGALRLDAASPLQTVSAQQTPKHRNRRSLVIEDDDDASMAPPIDALPSMTGLPPYNPALAHIQGSERLPYSSNDSFPGSVGVPVFFEDKTMYGKDAFPSSPFATPLKEGISMEAQASHLSPDFMRPPRSWQDNARDVSWIDDPLFRASPRSPVNEHDDEEEMEEEEEEQVHDDEAAEDITGELEERPVSIARSDDYPLKEESLHRSSSGSASRHYSAEPEDHASLEEPQSHGDVLSDPPTVPDQEEDEEDVGVDVIVPDSDLIQTVPPTPNSVLPWEDARPIAPAMELSTSTSKNSRWEKVKQSFSRSNSRNGRRSRTNSVGTRDNTLSMASRESGISQGSARAEKDGTFAAQQATPPTLSPSASATMLNFVGGPMMPSRSGQMSPVPPAAAVNVTHYTNAKLNPFPGITRLEEERNRSKNATPLPQSASDLVLTASTSTDTSGASPSTWSSVTARHADGNKDRKVTQQRSDTGLATRFQPSPLPMSAANSQSSQTDYADSRSPSRALLHSGSSQNLKQGNEKGGIKGWFSSKKLFSPTTPSTPIPGGSPSMEPVMRQPPRIPSLSDLLKGNQKDDLSSGWEDVLVEPSSSADADVTPIKSPAPVYSTHPVAFSPDSRDSSQSPEEIGTPSSEPSIPRYQFFKDTTSTLPSPPERIYSSATPDPSSSLDEYPTRASSASSSTLSSRYSAAEAPEPESNKGPEVLQRLEEMLSRGSRSPMWASAVDAPPRKLVLSSPVLQVVNSNTVKDRFLFMFNDILVIAKPILQDHDILMETKPSPLDRKFVVKNIVRLNELRLSADRDEVHPGASVAVSNPVIRQFVQQFAMRPEQAVSDLFATARSRDDPSALGHLLFRTIELDKRTLGEYLARRSSRVVLKSYIDGLGLSGLRLDKALRAFLLSVHVPPRSTLLNPLEHMVDAVAGRWYEANAENVPYHKDLAVQLVRALLQLNEVFHGMPSDKPGPTTYPKRSITSRDFISAFRQYDKAGIVSDDLLDQVYMSIRDERLVYARASSQEETNIVSKRPLPTRLTYRIQSDPVMLRIPAPDPNLRIELHGDGLTFDPPVLDFSRSSDVSFRVTGTSLGPKTITYLRAGPNAVLYGGLPYSTDLVVERAFMRNTFQLAFLDHDREKRKYMFSVDDPLLRHQWLVSLRRQADLASSARSSNTGSTESSSFHRATENLSIKVLQQTLIGTTTTPPRILPNMTSIDVALQRVASQSAKTERQQRHDERNNALASLHVRSKSRSKVYHRHGPGKLEPDACTPTTPHHERFGSSTSGTPGEERTAKTWSGRDLEIVCQQNSSISLVLSFLQIGSPDHESFRWSAALK